MFLSLGPQGFLFGLKESKPAVSTSQPRPVVLKEGALNQNQHHLRAYWKCSFRGTALALNQTFWGLLGLGPRAYAVAILIQVTLMPAQPCEPLVLTC